MTDRDPPLLKDAKQQVAALAADLRRMVGLRWQLAALELQAAVGSAKWLAVVLVAAAVTGLTALPVLVVYAAERIALLTDISRTTWLLVFGLGLLTLATVGAWLAWRRFRREFVGLEETLEELREDLLWLREMGDEGVGNRE